MKSVRVWATSLVTATLALQAGCRPRPAAAPPPAEPTASAPLKPPPIPTPPVLGRGELLSAVAEAASAAAARSAPPEAATALAGRRFSLRLPFGCSGPSPDGGAGYVYDAKRKTLKVTVRPETWTDVSWVRALVGAPQTEAIEGFWLRRPWLQAEQCPPPPPSPDPAPAPGAPEDSQPPPEPPAAPPASPETIGLAQVFEAGGSRLQRRDGRPFEATEKAEADPLPGQGGFRLVLEGRFAAPETGGPIRCRAAHPDVRPVCLVMVDIDRVAFEDAGGRQIAEWRP